MAPEEGGLGRKITIGVCVMEKKVKCGSEVLSVAQIHVFHEQSIYDAKLE